MSGTIRKVKGLLKNRLLTWLTSVPDPYSHPRVSVGRHTYGLATFTVRSYSQHDRLVVGNFCSIAKDVKLVLGGEHFTERVTNYPLRTYLNHESYEVDTGSRGSIQIGHDVWIGTGAIILSGARVGNGVVIAAGAVVKGNVDDFAIVGGVPAKLIRYRFDERQRQALARIAWWDWPDDVIRARLEHFYGDVDRFIEIYGSDGSGRPSSG